MRKVLIASCEFSNLCRLIARALHPYVGSNMVSNCFGAELERLMERDHFDLTGYGFVLLRLSPYSHQKDSVSYQLESALIAEAVRRRIQIGIICAVSGKITAPYIEGEVINRIALVVANDLNEGCSAQELYPNAGFFNTTNGDHTISEVAAFIAQQLPAPRPVRSEPMMTRPQLAASNAPQSNYTD